MVSKCANKKKLAFEYSSKRKINLQWETAWTNKKKVNYYM